jgi:hypothetical protein
MTPILYVRVLLDLAVIGVRSVYIHIHSRFESGIVSFLA